MCGGSQRVDSTVRGWAPYAASNIRSNTKTTPPQSNQSTLSARASTARQRAIEWIDSSPIKVARRLQMHDTLGLGRSSVEYATGPPEDPKDVGIFGTFGPETDPAYINAGAFHGDLLFDADGETVERADGSSMLLIVLIQVACPLESPLWEEFRYAIRLAGSVNIFDVL